MQVIILFLLLFSSTVICFYVLLSDFVEESYEDSDMQNSLTEHRYVENTRECHCPECENDSLS